MRVAAIVGDAVRACLERSAGFHDKGHAQQVTLKAGLRLKD
jgi:hypothetical protein